ncbi:MAG: T9SS type A sorting domain-containing protein [Melioribacteraceae bacterium]|nr:MAG: T9SS type A sorting domain-containing protein [Melioribacteraceae bacterium]
MKKLLFILFIFLWGGVNHFTSASESAEFRVHIRNNLYAQEVEITLSRVSLCWDYNHQISNSFLGDTKYTEYNDRLGWDFYNAAQPYDDDLALARYKCSSKIDGLSFDYFYIDYRTSDLPGSYSAAADIDVYFNTANGNFYWNEALTISVGSSYTIWGLNASIDYTTTGLEPYTPDSFDLTSSNNHPYLTWSHSSEEDYWTNYAIYRSVVSGDNPPGNFSKIETVSKYTTSYTDNDFVTGSPNTAYYKIVAVNGTAESDFTATKSIGVAAYKTGNEQTQHTYELHQNYPNPFNPSTNINYTIAKNDFVSIKVFNMLGEEVADLVSSIQTAGSYTIRFDAGNLPAGVYLYKINTSNFTNAKKLLLIK